jgi:hypothetical protein
MATFNRRPHVRSAEAGIMSRPNQDARAADEVAMLRARWERGARTAFEGEHDGGSYPPNFHTWELGRRNAWFSGFVRGYLDRLRITSEREG